MAVVMIGLYPADVARRLCAGIVIHYKWTGSSWSNVSTLPYDFYYGSAVVYNNEIRQSRFREYYQSLLLRSM